MAISLQAVIKSQASVDYADIPNTVEEALNILFQSKFLELTLDEGSSHREALNTASYDYQEMLGQGVLKFAKALRA